jgi:hypothetical protein
MLRRLAKTGLKFISKSQSSAVTQVAKPQFSLSHIVLSKPHKANQDMVAISKLMGITAATFGLFFKDELKQKYFHLTGKSKLIAIKEKLFPEEIKEAVSILTEKYKHTEEQALDVLAALDRHQIFYLSKFSPNEVRGLTECQLKALVLTKELGVKAEDIRYSVVLESEMAITVFKKIIEQGESANKALTEMEGFYAGERFGRSALEALQAGIKRAEILYLLDDMNLQDLAGDCKKDFLCSTKLNAGIGIFRLTGNREIFKLLSLFKEFSYPHYGVFKPVVGSQSEHVQTNQTNGLRKSI